MQPALCHFSYTDEPSLCPHVSALPEESAARPEIDIVARGEGEDTWIDISNHVEKWKAANGKFKARDMLDPQNKMLDSIMGITYQGVDGKIRHTHERPSVADLDALLGLCEASSCRRVRLLDYFGEASAPCGNCDVCLEPPQVWDGTVAAQKALSCVYRTGQRFGAAHLPSRWRVSHLPGARADQARGSSRAAPCRSEKRSYTAQLCTTAPSG